MVDMTTLSSSSSVPVFADDQPPSNRSAHGKLHALTSLRFFAAAMVVVVHTRGFLGTPATLLEPFVLAQGVSFFFVLSGFILTYVYPTITLSSMRRFLVARFARVWPMHIVTFLLSFFIIPASARFHPDGFGFGPALLNITLLHAWIPDQRYFLSINPVSWSISVEAFFYICFPLFLWRRPCAWMMKISIAFILLLALVTLANRLAKPPIDTTFVAAIVYINPLSRILEFLSGVAAARIWQHLRYRIALSRVQGTLCESAIFAIVAVLMYHSKEWSYRSSGIHWIGYAGAYWLQVTGFVVLPFAALILVLALEQGWLSHALSIPPFVLLGDISYSLYLLHFIFFNYYWAHPDYFLWIPQRFLYSAYWIALVVASYLFWTTIEIPCWSYPGFVALPRFV